MIYDYYLFLGPYFSWIGLFCGVFFFMYSVRYYVVSILVLMKDQKSLQEHIKEESARAHLGFTITTVNMEAHLKGRFRKMFSSKKKLGFKTTRVQTEKLMTAVARTEAGFVTQKINMVTNKKYQAVLKKLRGIFWDMKVQKDKITIYPARLGVRKQLHAMMMTIMQKSNYDDLRKLALSYWSEAKQYLSGQKSMTVDKKKALLQTNKLNNHHNYNSKYLGFTKSVVGSTKKLAKMAKKTKVLIALDSIDIVDNPDLQPFISIHLAFYNEENVAERCIEACLAQDYEQYEIVIADDSNDGTTAILARYEHNPRIKVVRRDNRTGFKGGALKVAIEQTDPRAKFITVYDADFVPPPNTLKNFMKEFFVQNGNSFDLEDEEKNLAAVQGYQWHILNKDENFVTAGIRFGFAGGYMVERVAQQYFGAMKMIAGSVFVIRRDVMEKFGWQMPDGYTSIVEDWNLTIRMYLNGWKIGYTPNIKVPAECVNSLSRLSKQQIRWAEGHTWNVKTYFWKVMMSAKMSLIEKLEFLHYGPFYLQSAFFIIGTFGWIVGELIFHAKVPGWTATLGWSLVFTNLMALPVMCISGIVLERGENRDYNILPFLTFVYYIIPSLAYASVRGLVSAHESGWVRTKKTGSITDGVMEGNMAGDNEKLIDKNVEIFKEGIEKAAASYQKSHPMYKAKPSITEDLAKGRLWMELKRIPRLGFLIIMILSLTVGSLGYIATTEKTMASPDVLYLNSPQYLSYYTANSPEEVAIGPNNTSYSWLSDMCPTGDDPGGVAAGNYSAYLVLNQKPTVDKVYSMSVGHVDESGGDYQAITSTTMTINQSTPSLLSINLGNGPEIVCNPDNKRKLVFSIDYLYAPSGCDSDCEDDGCDSKTEQCSVSYKSEDSVKEASSLQTKQFVEEDKEDSKKDEDKKNNENKNNKEKKDKKDKKLSFNLDSFSIQKAEACEIPDCGDVCFYESDKYFYTALQDSTSGIYPDKGTESDSVYLTYHNPSSDGYLDLNLLFTDIPENFTGGNLSMNFLDLDLQGDYISGSRANATLFEAFTLYDYNNNQLAHLDSSYGADDNFVWDIDIDDSLIQNGTLNLRMRMTAEVNLTYGRSITLQNTEEGIKDITFCGTNECITPEELVLTVDPTCEGNTLNWDEYTESADGYKIIRSTTDPELTYPEDGYIEYISNTSTTTYVDADIEEGQSYYYRVGVYEGGEIISYSNTIQVESSSDCGPTEEIELAVNPTCDGNDLDWSEYTEDADGYKIIRSTTDPELTYPEDGYIEYITDLSEITYQDTDIEEGQNYYYRVGVYNNSEIITYSNTVQITSSDDCGPTQCDECDGGVTYLNMQYNGSQTANITVKDKKNNVLFSGSVNPGAHFSFIGATNHDKMGPKIKFYINNNFNAELHTSCSQPIGPGTIAGDFMVVDGTSLDGGSFCGSCVPSVGVEFDCDMHSVYVESDKELSNVVLQLDDGSHQKFDNLSGYSGTFSPTGEHEGKLITGVWVKSGCNDSGDGSGYGEYFENPHYPEGCPDEHCCEDDLVIEFNNSTSTISTPSIIVPEFTLLLGAPLVGYWYLQRKKKNQKNKSKK